jgi:isopenicillin N synthase-like dioxygenase
VDAYSLEASKLAYRLLEFMARGVGADPASLQGMFQGQVQGMRVNYYPPCRQAADQVLGLSPHSDPNGLTLLLQMSHDVHGLQVSKDGRWFPVQALPGAFVVNDSTSVTRSRYVCTLNCPSSLPSLSKFGALPSDGSTL